MDMFLKKTAAAMGSAAATGGTGAGASAAMEEDDGVPLSVSHELPLDSRALPWVEKYRPRAMADISSQEDTVRTLTQAIRTGSIPHLLFFGPPGSGKTSTILAVARELYGPELMRSRVMELNASDERGIAVVREKVKAFAMSSVGASSTAPPFKLIILDEADSLTADAQAALRRTIENYSKVTRFCIICNYISRIIDPLASRCSKMRFRALDRPAMLARLHHVARAESVHVTDAVLGEVLKVSGGDLRKAITFMQSAAALYGGDITAERVVEISGIFPDSQVEATLAVVRRGGFEAVRRQAQAIIAAGYGIGGVFEKLVDAVAADATLAPLAKAVIVERVAAAEKRLADGADEELQLQDVLAAAARAAAGRPLGIDRERVVIA